MKAKELHVALDLELQKINSASELNILAAEKDWFLNKEALKYVNKALEISTNPKESWLQFAAGLNIEKGNYKKAIFALNKLVKINPNKATYWKMRVDFLKMSP